MHFEHLKSSQEGTNSHCFGMMSDFGSTSDYYHDATQKDSEAAILDKLNASLDDSSSSSSYEDEPIVSEHGPGQSPLPSLSEKQRDQLINSSKTMAKLSDHIQSLGDCERFNTKILYFCKSSLTLFHSGLDDVLTNYNMMCVSVPPNGNCFFLSIAYAIKNHIIGNQLVSSDLARHIDLLGLLSCSDTYEMCSKLREQTVHEWMSHPEEYQPFLGTL